MTDAATEQSWTDLLQALPDPVLVVAPDGQIEQGNVEAARLLGYQPDELAGLALDQLVPADVQALHRSHHAGYLADRPSGPMSTGPNVRAVRKDGSQIFIEVNLSTVHRPTGPVVLASLRDVSARLRAEGELRDSEQRFRLAFDGAPTAMVMTDLTSRPLGALLRVNRAMCELTGYTENELIGRNLAELTHPDDLQVAGNALAPLVSGAVNEVSLAKRYLHADGHEIWVQLSVSMVRGPTGNPAYTICQLADITTQRQDRAALELRFDQLADNVTVGFALRQLDPPELLYCNRAYVALFGDGPGYPSPTLGETRGRIHPADQQRAESRFADCAAGHRVVQEIRTLTPTGSIRWVRCTIDPVRGSDGSINQLTGVFEDITEHKQAELVLRESEQRFVQLADSLNVGITLRQLDPPKLLYVNPAFVEIAGSNPVADREGQIDDALSVVHPDDRLLVQERYWKRAQLGHFAESEHRIVRPDGQVRWIRLTSNPVPTAGAVTNLAAGTMEDITERKLAEAAARSAQAEAEQANAAKGEFLSRMSHELRTPLNAVLGFAQLLELDALTSSQASAVEHILRGGNHLLAMINDVLDITGIEADRLQVEPEAVALLSLLRDTIDLMRPAAADSGIRLRFAPDPAAAGRFVLADPRRIKQVLLNLLSNAIKYNRPGGTVEVRIESRSDHRLGIGITDTGLGIPAEDLPRLFTPFDRLGRQAGIEGTGIGLTLSKRLIELMDGELEVASVAGQGSTFTAWLPSLDPAAATDPASPSRPTDLPPVQPVSSTLLYIEDEPSNVALVSGILRRRPDWTMVHAGNGGEGLELARTCQPQAILLDLNLPDLDGEQVLVALRTGGLTVPVAILSADASPSQPGRLLAAGAQAYLTKPLDVPQMLAFLDQHVRRSAAG